MQNRKNFIVNAADQCVKCGLCLPHCPTYQLSGVEAESPRGRIGLIQGLMQSSLPADATWQAHMDRCLLCLACEKACPAKVPYGELMDQTRSLIRSRYPRPWLQRLIGLVENPKTMRRLHRLLYWAQRLGLTNGRPGRRLGRFLGMEHWLAALPPLQAVKTWNRCYPAPHPGPQRQSKQEKKVALFTGCMAQLDQETIDDSIEVLNRLGYDVLIPPEQSCCGALAAHNGYMDRAQALARLNRRVFSACGASKVLFTASGCGAALIKQSGANITYADLYGFLAADPGIGQLAFSPLHATVAYHQPCSQRNSLGSTESVTALLALIPNLHLKPLESNPVCCGAAGSYMLSQPENAMRLRARKHADMEKIAGDYVVSPNIGCALHLRQGNQTPVWQPIRLLKKQLRDSAHRIQADN